MNNTNNANVNTGTAGSIPNSSKFISRITNHFNDAVNNCNTTLIDTRRVAFVIIALILILIISVVLGWSKTWVYIILLLLGISALYIGILVSKNVCFQTPGDFTRNVEN